MSDPAACALDGPFCCKSRQVDEKYIAGLAEGDHRKFNVAGAAFDKGETWSGLGENLYDAALPAVAKLKTAHSDAVGREELSHHTTLAQVALRWCLDQDGVSCVIPGARNTEQALGNVGAASLPPLSDKVHAEVKAVYEAHIKELVEKKW